MSLYTSKKVLIGCLRGPIIVFKHLKINFTCRTDLDRTCRWICAFFFYCSCFRCAVTWPLRRIPIDALILHCRINFSLRFFLLMCLRNLFLMKDILLMIILNETKRECLIFQILFSYFNDCDAIIANAALTNLMILSVLCNIGACCLNLIMWSFLRIE